MTEDNFILLFLKGDPKTLNTIYKSSFTHVKNYIVSHGGSKKDAEDVFHNALLHLYVKLKNNALKITSFESYLFIVCKNLWKREAKKKWVTNNEVIPLISEDVDRAQFYIEQTQWDIYQEKFSQLAKQCQDILKLVFNKKPYSEIVKIYNYASENVARQRVFKCKTKLVKLIKKDSRFLNLKRRK